MQGPGVDEERPRAQRGEVLQHGTDRTIGGNLIIGRDRRLRVGLRQFGRFAHAREMAIGGRAVGGDLGERRLGLAAFAGLGERSGRLEGSARLGSFLRLPPHVAAPGRNRHDQQNGGGDGVIAVALPQLLELFSPNFLVDFPKDVGHGPPQSRFTTPATRQLAD